MGSVSNATNLSSTVSVAVSGHYAYTTAYQAGQLTAVDISNPASPSIAGESPSDLHLIGGSNVAIAGGYAFVVSKNRNASTSNNDDGNGNSLTILDIHSNPASRRSWARCATPNKLFGAYGIAVSGNYAYVAYQGVLSGQPSVPDTSTGGFTVIDITTRRARRSWTTSTIRPRRVLGQPVRSLDFGAGLGPLRLCDAFYDER